MKYTKITALLPLIFATGCGSGVTSGGTGSTASNVFNAAFQNISSASPEMATSSFSAVLKLRNQLRSNSTTPTASMRSAMMTSSLSALWDNADTTNFMTAGSGSSNPRGFAMSMFEIDSSSQQSIPDRAKTPFLIACTLDILGEKTGDLLNTGTQTFTFTRSALEGICGSNADFGNGAMWGQGGQIVVGTPGDTTNYDRFIKMLGADNPIFSSSDQWMYIRNNDSVLNFMHIEKQATSVMIDSLAYNKTTQVGMFQLADKSAGQESVLRVYFDIINDEARALGYKKDVGGSRTATINVAMPFSSQDFAAMSLAWTGMGGAYTTDLADGAACVQTSDASLETDNSLTCAATGKTALAAAGASGLKTAVAALNGTTIASDADAGDLGTTLPTFNAGTILSAALGI